MPYHVSKPEFESLVERALAEVPAEFAQILEEVPVEIRSRPTPEQLRTSNIPEGHLLLGLYRGRPRTIRSVEDSGAMPDVIYIFQQHIELACNSEAQLVDQVRKTVLHEIGHHFGMSEKDLDELGYG